MDTLSHALIGIWAYRFRRGWPAFLLGTIVPDIPLFVAGVIFIRMNGSIRDVYEVTMSWMWVREITYWLHSLVTIAALLLIGRLLRSICVSAFAWGQLLHIAIDFFTHADDGSPPFWPFSLWQYHSPISYWQQEHFARPFTLAATVALFYLLYRWFVDKYKRRV